MPRPIRLSETPDAAPVGATIIDADYVVVKRRTIVGRIKWWLAALALAVLAGALLPPLAQVASTLMASV